MSKANEMFEELGYDEIEKFANGITYYNSDDNYIEFVDYENYGKTVNCDKFEGITMKELQAINEKIKELGWNENKTEDN